MFSDDAHPGEARVSSVPLLVVVVGAAISTLLSPWSRDLFIGDETRYGRVVHEMEASRDYLVPRLGGEPYSHKPPVHFWTVILASRLPGFSGTAGFVLPSLVGYVFSILLCGVVAGRRFGRFSGLTAALVMATFWLSWGSAQSARMDMSYCVLVTLAILAVWRHLESGETMAVLLGGLLTGLAVLVKGPMAIPIVGLFFVLESVRRHRRPALSSLGALAVALLITALWLVPAIGVGGDAYGRELVVDQSLGRAFSSWVHVAPPWFYLVRSPVTFFPWMPLLALALFAAWKARRSAPDAIALVSWFVSVVGPYSLISSKLDVYMILALPPSAILLGWWAMSEKARSAIRWNGLAVAFGLGLLALAANFAVPFLDPSDPDVAPWIVPDVRAALWLATTVCFGAGVLISGSRDRARGLALTAAAAIAPLALLLGLALDVINEEMSTTRLNRVLARSGVSPERITMHWTPYLWGRDLDPELHRVEYGFPSESAATPEIVVVREDHRDDLGEELDPYEKTGSVTMIAKEFGVYRLRHGMER